MKNIISLLFAFFINISVLAQTPGSVPPTQVPQSDGTIQLVPVPPGIVYTPYFIDPTMKYQLKLESNWATVDWNGTKKTGQVAIKDSIIEVSILAMPIAKTKIVNGKTVYMWSIFRSLDAIITWDNTKLELLPVQTSSQVAFDTSVFDLNRLGFPTTSIINEEFIPKDGNALFHCEALPAPENRIPPQAPKYYQWNLNGYMWSSAYRMLGKIRFRVKDDFYYPTQLTTDIKIIPSINVNGVEYKTSIDGSPTIGTNILSEIRSGANAIVFGAGPDHKVSHYLSAPTTKYKVGDIVPVKIMVKPESGAQKISYVATNFVWDTTKLEFIGLDGIGAKPAQTSVMWMIGAGNINEVSIPKDGTAEHNWLSKLGDKSYITGETLIVTLRFKVVSTFDVTTIEIVKQDDPRLAGFYVPEESAIGGSDIPGYQVTGQQYGVNIFGLVP